MKLTKNCKRCGLVFHKNHSSDYNWNKKEYCSRNCKACYNSKRNYKYIKKGIKGSKNPNWKGGIIKNCNGYILIKKPDHPFCNNHGYVYEHRLIMENHLGRYLNSQEVIHHLDGVEDNNNINNLNLFPSSIEHKTYHWRLINYVEEMIGGHHEI